MKTNNKDTEILISDIDLYKLIDIPVDLDELMSKGNSPDDYSDEELAIISYQYKGKITEWNAPMLHKPIGRGKYSRIYTRDLPKKLFKYFLSNHTNLDVNEHGYIEKRDVYLLEGFLSDNHIGRRTHYDWCERHPAYGDYYEMGQLKLVQEIANGSLNGVVVPAQAQSILNNISEYSNKLKIETYDKTSISHRTVDMEALSKLNTQELEALLLNPGSLLKKDELDDSVEGDYEEVE